MQTVLFAMALLRVRAGKSKAARIAITAMTTRSSIRVNPRLWHSLNIHRPISRLLVLQTTINEQYEKASVRGPQLKSLPAKERDDQLLKKQIDLQWQLLTAQDH